MISAIEKAETGSGKAVDIEAFKTAFEATLNDDFNSAQAIAVLFEYLKDIRKRITDNDIPSNLSELKIFLKAIIEDVLGIWPVAAEGGKSGLTEGLIELLIEIRKEARTSKNFALSDKVRDDLKKLDVQLMDGKDGTTFSID